MKNYEKYFWEKFTQFKGQLKERFEKEVKERPGARIDLYNDFLSAIIFEKETMLHSRDDMDKNASSFNVLHNQFKEELVERFNYYKRNYPDSGINGFVQYDIPKLKEKHGKNYQRGNKKSYTSDPNFMYKANTEEILDLIARYKAYSDFLANQDRSAVLDLEVSFKEKPKREQGTIAQIITLILLLNEEYRINWAQDKKRLVELVHFLSGWNKKSISDYIGKYRINRGELHLTLEKNIKDLQRVKSVLKELENQKLIDRVDGKINKQEQKKRKV